MEVAKEKLVTNSVDDSSSSKGKVHNQTSRTLPSFSVSGKIGEAFKKWLTGSCVGYKKDKQVQQIVKRCFKFLQFCCEDEGEDEDDVTFEVMEFSLCFPNLFFKFIDYLQEEGKLGYWGRSQKFIYGWVVPGKNAQGIDNSRN